MIDNILRILDQASPEEVSAGERWYPEAHAIARDLALGLPISHRWYGDVERSSAVLSRFSVQTSWPLNQRYAGEAYAALGSQDPTAGIMGIKTLGATRQAVSRLLVAGESVSSVMTGIKTRDFARCILHPWNEDTAVVDRHAVSIAVGRPLSAKQVGMSKRRYTEVADAYRHAASEAGLLPLIVQAVTWVVWRNHYAAALHK